jgi:hypothetical protein
MKTNQTLIHPGSWTSNGIIRILVKEWKSMTKTHHSESSWWWVQQRCRTEKLFHPVLGSWLLQILHSSTPILLYDPCLQIWDPAGTWNQRSIWEKGINFSIKRVYMDGEHMMAWLREIEECVVQCRTEINHYIYSNYGCLKPSCIK